MTTKSKAAAQETQVEENAAVAAPATKLKFTVKKRVTLPLIKPKLDVPVFIKINEPVFVGKKLESGASKDMEAATLANVTDLETGEEAQIIVPSVLAGIFKDEYADDAYVGLSFQLTKHPKVSGKRYHNFTVVEIEVE